MKRARNVFATAASLLALGGVEALPPDPMATAMNRIADALSSRPAANVTVTVPEREIHISTPITLDAKIEANRTVTKTVVSERLADGSIVSKVTEQ